MKISLVGQLVNGEVIPMNTKGYEEVEIELADINILSQNKSLRLIGIGKQGLYKMTLKSWKELKKELNKRGLMYRVAA
ncbi:MAG: hypothetical protein ACI4U4_04295 [Bacilli bacterium]